MEPKSRVDRFEPVVNVADLRRGDYFRFVRGGSIYYVTKVDMNGSWARRINTLDEPAWIEQGAPVHKVH